MRLEGSSLYAPYALVRWYEATGERLAGTDMVCLRWGEGTLEYGVIPTSSIRRPVTVQTYPHLQLADDEDDMDMDMLVSQDQMLYNHFL